MPTKRQRYGVMLDPELAQREGGNGRDEDIEDWVPPVNQKGDGKTSLNEKFGY